MQHLAALKLSINLKVCLSSTTFIDSMAMTPRWIWSTLFFKGGCNVRQWLRLPSTSAVLHCFALFCFWSKVAYLMPLQLGYNWVFLQAWLLFWYLQLQMLAKSGRFWLNVAACVKLIRSDDFDKEKRKILNQVNGGRSRWSDSWHVWLLNIKLQKCWSNVPTLSALTCNCHQQKWSSRSCHLAVRCQCPYGVEETPQ